jgi:hypothetical protein
MGRTPVVNCSTQSLRADEIRSEEKKALKAAQELKRKREEEAELAKRHEQAQAKEKAAQEAELRARYGPQARAEANQITTALNDLAEGKDSWAKSKFPKLARWYDDRRIEGWEYVAQDNQITDYGTVDWKDRRLDAVFTDDSISMKNRLLGENKTFCFSLGLIFDQEFQMYREPFLAPCEDASGPSKAWKRARGFQSHWIAEGEATPSQ